ncbi:kinesin-like protein KIF20A [Bombina bombina]|uniref:kinesin-like protein KIF20A n=1 Tax=Bombina bombina TaxID=8345 RepID=UPI00235B1468|nr:kinesin-like protein KIF20A [Bombina bombina]
MCKATKDTDQVSQPLKVYLRVRPFSKAELASNESQDCIVIENEETVSLQAPKDSSAMKNCERGIGQAVHKFTFTQIFGPETKQADFFDGTMRDVVNAFVTGQNGLVFTYGVTNAGKTFTIQGSPKDGGILPRSLDVIFNHIGGRHYPKMNLKPYLSSDVMKLDAAQIKQEEAMKASLLSLKEVSVDERGMRTVNSSSNLYRNLSTSLERVSSKGSMCASLNGDEKNAHQFSAWVSFFEIYNEYIYDLLDQFPSSKNQKRNTLKICDDQSGSSYVKDLKWVNINSTAEACKILHFGNKNRSLASTRMNQQSSRSHSIFTIRLLKLSAEDDPSVLGVSEISLCDLAGSERCNKTQTVGDRLKEAGNINNSLLILGKCIGALKQSQNPKKTNYVPFRESKLTRLFQPFFCGRGKACMIVNINQCASTYDETLHVMKFSAVAKQVVQVIQPRNFDFMGPRIVGKDGKAILEIEGNLSIDELLSEDEEEIDVSILSADDLLNKIESLRDKLIAERQNKLVLELQIRKEMGEAMYQQMVDLDETWSKRFEDLKDTYDEQLESRLEMYRKAIKNHAYRQAMEDLEDNYVPLEEFQLEQEKVEVRESRIKELEMALSIMKNRGESDETYPEFITTSSTLDALSRKCQEKDKIISTLNAQIQTMKDTAALNVKQFNDENEMLRQHLKLKDQEVKGLQSIAERALLLEASVADLQEELEKSRNLLSSTDGYQPKPKRGLFSNLKLTMSPASKNKSKSTEKHEETPATTKRSLRFRK